MRIRKHEINNCDFLQKKRGMYFVHMLNNNLFWCFERDRVSLMKNTCWYEWEVRKSDRHHVVIFQSVKSVCQHISIGSISFTTLLMNRLSLSILYPVCFYFHAEQFFFFIIFSFLFYKIYLAVQLYFIHIYL